MICIIDEDHARSVTTKEDDLTLDKRKRIASAVDMIAQYYKTTYPTYKKKLNIRDIHYSKDLIVLSFKRAK